MKKSCRLHENKNSENLDDHYSLLQNNKVITLEVLRDVIKYFTNPYVTCEQKYMLFSWFVKTKPVAVKFVKNMKYLKKSH